MEYIPLLSPGLQPKTLAELKQLCVDNFPLSKTRILLMDGLEEVVNRFRNNYIPIEIWVDGSFVTEKIDPNDVDIVLRIEQDRFVQMATNQRDIVLWYANADLSGPYGCDNYHFFEYPTGHPDFDKGQIARDYWLNLL